MYYITLYRSSLSVNAKAETESWNKESEDITDFALVDAGSLPWTSVGNLFVGTKVLETPLQAWFNSYKHTFVKSRT